MTSMIVQGVAIPVEEKEDPCRHGCALAVGRYSLPKGCVCFSDDTEQDLCAQHVVKGGDIGGMFLIKVYQPESGFFVP